MEQICSVENCQKSVYSSGKCNKHYRESLHKGEKCSVDGCENQPKSRGYCVKHHKKFLKYGDPLGKYEFIQKGKFCKIDGCNDPVKALGYCNLHWIRFHNHGDPTFTKTERHGMEHTPEMCVYKGMKTRCYYKNSNRYKNYGGRGITVCDRWKKSFSAFYEDMGPRPSMDYQLDRIDNDGNYESGNCQWITAVENQRKKPSTKLNVEKVKIIREMHSSGQSSLTELGRFYGVTPECIGLVVHNKNWKTV